MWLSALPADPPMSVPHAVAPWRSARPRRPPAAPAVVADGDAAYPPLESAPGRQLLDLLPGRGNGTGEPHTPPLRVHAAP